MIKVSPSILAADPLRLGEEAQRMVDAGCDWLHVDIMDGCFVPNLSYGPSLVKALRGRFSIPLDVHLMIAHPERYVETFIAAGADWLTIHAEAAEDLPRPAAGDPPPGRASQRVPEARHPRGNHRGGAAPVRHGAGDDRGAGLWRPALHG